MRKNSRALAILAGVLLLAVTPASNQCITRGYVYSEVGTLFTWSGGAPAWSGSNQVATYADFTGNVANNGSCGGSSSELITYGAATGCAVNVVTVTGNGQSTSSATCTYKSESGEWSCNYAGLDTYALSISGALAASASTPVSGSYTLASDSGGVTSVILASSGGGAISLPITNGTHSFGPYTSTLAAGTISLTFNVMDDPSCNSPPLQPSDCSYASFADVTAASLTAYR